MDQYIKNEWCIENDFAAQRELAAIEEARGLSETEKLRAQLAASEQRVKKLEKFEQQMKTLQALCGHIEDGSNDSVTLSQDDATGTWHITVGYSPRKRKSFWGESFDEVFLKAKFYVESTE